MAHKRRWHYGDPVVICDGYWFPVRDGRITNIPANVTCKRCLRKLKSATPP